MARVTFVVPSVLNSGGGERRVELDASTLREAVAAAAGVMGDEFARRVLEDPSAPEPEPRSLINVFLNGKNAQFSGGLAAELRDGDEVYMLPAVAGGSPAELSSTDLDRYSRQVMLEGIGYEGQLALRSARACIVGAGGLGHPVAARLAAMGVGRMRLVDRDVIELSNLHRQVLFRDHDVGAIKVEVAAERLREMSPGLDIEAVAMSVSDASAPAVVADCDVVIDALDSVNARYALNRACVMARIPLVSGAAVGTSGQALTILPGKSACYHCVFPALDEDSMPTCSIEGVHPAVLSVIGGIEAAEAVKVITRRRPALADRMLHVDIDTMAFTTTRTARADECAACGKDAVVTVAHPTRDGMIVEELCGRNRGKRTFSLTPAADYRGSVDLEALASRAAERGYDVKSSSTLGVSLAAGAIDASFMARGSAVIVGTRDEDEAVRLYSELAAA